MRDATELGAMHNLPVNAGVAGHKLGTAEAPQCAPCGLFLHAWPVQAHGRRAGVMVGCAAMVWEMHGFWEQDSMETSVVLIEGYLPDDRVTVRFHNFILLCWEYY